jgi:hypothetical protein
MEVVNPVLTLFMTLSNGACTIKKFMAVIVAYCDKLDCLPLPFTSIAYYDTATIKGVKSFLLHTPGGNVKTFFL